MMVNVMYKISLQRDTELKTRYEIDVDHKQKVNEIIDNLLKTNCAYNLAYYYKIWLILGCRKTLKFENFISDDIFAYNETYNKYKNKATESQKEQLSYIERRYKDSKLYYNFVKLNQLRKVKLCQTCNSDILEENQICPICGARESNYAIK